MKTVLQAVRYLGAVLLAPMMSFIGAVPIAVALDIIFGGFVIGGNAPLTLPNALLSIFTGALTGWFAGWIAGRYGKVVAAITNMAPLIIIGVALSSRHELRPDSLWANTEALNLWIGLIPAIIGGHFAVKFSDIPTAAFPSVVGVTLGLVAQLMWVIFHLYTVYVAFHVAGFGAAFLTLMLPPLSEFFWLYRLWHDLHSVTNLYWARMFLCLAVSVAAYVLTTVGSYFRARRERSLTMAMNRWTASA